MSVFNGGFGIADIVDEADHEELPFDDELTLEEQTALNEQFLIDEVSQFTDEERKEFLESDLCQQLQETGRMRKNTIVFLSGNDDISRRTKLSALSLAKKNKDPLFAKLSKKRVEERHLLGQIMRKYGQKGRKIAKKSQKDWIRNRMPKNFGRFGGSERVSTTPSAGNGNKPKKHGDGLVW